MNSNGETALRYFDERLKNDRLYCLDEPENSLSPKRQQELAAMLEQLVRYCGCQFIIATHSPFLLAMIMLASIIWTPHRHRCKAGGSWRTRSSITAFSSSTGSCLSDGRWRGVIA